MSVTPGSTSGCPTHPHPVPSPSSSQIACLVRHYDRNEITIWASEKSSIMKKCKAAVSPHPSVHLSASPGSLGQGGLGVLEEP